MCTIRLFKLAFQRTVKSIGRLLKTIVPKMIHVKRLMALMTGELATEIAYVCSLRHHKIGCNSACIAAEFGANRQRSPRVLYAAICATQRNLTNGKEDFMLLRLQEVFYRTWLFIMFPLMQILSQPMSKRYEAKIYCFSTQGCGERGRLGITECFYRCHTDLEINVSVLA